MSRRALGTLSVLVAVVAFAGTAAYIHAHPTVPVLQARAAAIVPASSTTTTSTTAPPPPPATVARAVTPVATEPPPPPAPPAEKPLTGPFWVGAALANSIRVYNAPNGQVTETLANPNEAGTTRTVLIKQKVDQNWYLAYLPTRPNEHTGYVRADDLSLSTVDTQILVERQYHRLTAWAGDQQIFQAPVAVGKPQWPTPAGMFYLQELISTGNPRGAYGPYVYGLSAHSDVFETFGGGDGLVGLHGTNEGGSIGRSASHGCIRLANANIAKLVTLVPVGTPIVIV